jgi:hypothetical protein
MTESSLESILSSLSHWVEQPASKSLANGYQSASLETELETERELEKETETALASPSLTVEQVMDLWNQIPGVVKSKAVTGPIRKRLIARLSDYPDQGWWDAYFTRIRASEFLTGRSKAEFAATLDWVLGPKNLAKILNGNYDNREPVRKESAMEAQARAFLGRA